MSRLSTHYASYLCFCTDACLPPAALVGCITQLRVFGGVIGVVICRVTQDAYLRANLAPLLSPQVFSELMSSLATISTLPSDQVTVVREAFGGSFNQQHRILTFIAAASFIVSIFTFRRHPLDIATAQNPDGKAQPKQDVQPDAERGIELTASHENEHTTSRPATGKQQVATAASATAADAADI